MNHTGDLFGDKEDYSRQTASELEAANTSMLTDTAEITELYHQRPGHFATMSMGAWFNAAHRLNDKDLALSVGSQNIKLTIIRKGYNKLPLKPLKDWNNKFTYDSRREKK
jgi:hypothetical protein